jgi:ribosomal protein L40E
MTCTNCGESNAPGTEFCGRCGTFLNWRAEEPAPVPAGAPAAEGQTAQQPVVQQPTDERVLRAAPVPLTTAPRPIAPGDLICGQCGAGNDPTRQFCRKCGKSLADAETARLPWWRRLFGRRRRTLGERPRARGGRPWRTAARLISRLLLVIVAVGGLLYATVPPVRTGVNTEVRTLKSWVAKQFSSKLVPARPATVTATASVPEHGAGLVADNARNTFWAAPAAGEPTLVLTFDKPVDLRQAIIRVGNAADFESTHRPAKLHLVYSTGHTFDVNLADTPDPQTVTIGESAGATTVEIHITAFHRSQKGNTVAISEIELFEPES